MKKFICLNYLQLLTILITALLVFLYPEVSCSKSDSLGAYLNLKLQSGKEIKGLLYKNTFENFYLTLSNGEFKTINKNSIMDWENLNPDDLMNVKVDIDSKGLIFDSIRAFNEKKWIEEKQKNFNEYISREIIFLASDTIGSSVKIKLKKGFSLNAKLYRKYPDYIYFTIEEGLARFNIIDIDTIFLLKNENEIKKIPNIDWINVSLRVKKAISTKKISDTLFFTRKQFPGKEFKLTERELLDDLINYWRKKNADRISANRKVGLGFILIPLIGIQDALYYIE